MWVENKRHCEPAKVADGLKPKRLLHSVRSDRKVRFFGFASE